MRLRHHCALLLALLGLLATPPIASAADGTLFIAKRPGLLVRIRAEGPFIRSTVVNSRVHCADGTVAGGSSLAASWFDAFRIGRKGQFEKGEWESWESTGTYFWRLSGLVRGNRIVGQYRAWEETLSLDEEGWLPRCGTRSPKGLPMRFVARRVAGPRWHR